MRLFLCGDVMTGRGIDQALPHSVDPVLYELYVRDARDYVALAEKAQELLAGPEYSPLLATLRRITAAKYRTAVSALNETRTAVRSFAAARKPPGREPATSTTRAASAVA